MGVKLIQESTLTDIANALRGVYGITSKIDPANYASLIANLEVSEKGLLLNKIDTCANNGNLDSISWNEINEISAALVDGTLQANEASGLLGLSKSFTYDSATCYAFIIGILQDYLDSTPRGFTFWCVGSNTPFSTSEKQLSITTKAIASTQNNSGGWGSCSDVLRPALQSGGSIYSAMPSEITAVMKPKTTYYGPSWSSTSSSVSSVTDYMFILSEKELYNINNPNKYSSGFGNYNRPYWAYEGTGAAHNEQYQLFANEGITITNFKKLVFPSPPFYIWLRTSGYRYSDAFMTVSCGGGGTEYGSVDYERGVTPCFCV